MQPVHIPFGEPRRLGRFVRRYKRFLADVRLEGGRVVTAHTANTGSMKGLLVPGARALLWDSANPRRKLRFSWVAVEVEGTWAGIDTGLPNRLAEAALLAGQVRGFELPLVVERERPMGRSSRVDLVVRQEGLPDAFVEVKNVTLVESRGGETFARFPDAVTARGLRHLEELEARVAEGYRAAMIYICQRADVTIFEPADDIDPAYGARLRQAHAAGVEVVALRARVSEQGVTLERELPFSL